MTTDSNSERSVEQLWDDLEGLYITLSDVIARDIALIEDAPVDTPDLHSAIFVDAYITPLLDELVIRNIDPESAPERLCEAQYKSYEMFCKLSEVVFNVVLDDLDIDLDPLEGLTNSQVIDMYFEVMSEMIAITTEFRASLTAEQLSGSQLPTPPARLIEITGGPLLAIQERIDVDVRFRNAIHVDPRFDEMRESAMNAGQWYADMGLLGGGNEMLSTQGEGKTYDVTDDPTLLNEAEDGDTIWVGDRDFTLTIDDDSVFLSSDRTKSDPPDEYPHLHVREATTYEALFSMDKLINLIASNQYVVS